MQIHLLRHGSAEDIPAGGADADRRLTHEGRDQLRRVLERAHAVGIVPSIILSSPLVRAVETAELAAKGLGSAARVILTDSLLPSASPVQVWGEIRRRSNETQILLAGHEPLLSRLAAHLLGVEALRLEMRKAMLLRIDMDDFGAVPHGTLKWVLPPEVLGG
ncbi:MAG TPA: histidine phosphatase family protein [Bryobacteraceae bacterium]|nr:histidine phosphatase family protein [Bryobacteraceae bacterium]